MRALFKEPKHTFKDTPDLWTRPSACSWKQLKEMADALHQQTQLRVGTHACVDCGGPCGQSKERLSWTWETDAAHKQLLFAAMPYWYDAAFHCIKWEEVS